MKAETSRDTADTLLEENRQNNKGPNSVAMSFMGTDGIMMKETLIDAIKHCKDLDGEGTVLDQSSCSRLVQRVSGNSRADADEQVRLPKVQCIVATKSTEAGINGKKNLKFAKCKGLPSSFYELS